MTDQNEAGTAAGRHKDPAPLPVVPSGKAERLEGLAFDVEPGAALTGVPTGGQVPGHPGAARTEQTVRESGEGVGLAVPGDQTAGDDE